MSKDIWRSDPRVFHSKEDAKRWASSIGRRKEGSHRIRKVGKVYKIQDKHRV